ncbi:MAG: RagB/SusD family nutrient uptake outer membrane protein [Chitinophagaceae bacterium]
MKNNFSRSFVIFIPVLFLFVISCKKDFLTVDPRATQVEANYYKNASQVFNGLVSVYDPLAWEAVGGYTSFASLNAASDDCYGGGGSSSDVLFINVMNNYTLDAATGPQGDYWSRGFTGVSRANTLLSKLEGKSEITGLADATRKRYIAEVKFLRGYYYFDLVRLFKNIPLFTAPLAADEIYKATQVPPADIYAQIEKDLLAAIAEINLPNTVAPATEGGRITKGAAYALLGKVYLNEKKWTEAAKSLAELNGNPGTMGKFGYRLLTSFPEIFRPDNKYHTESVFEIGHTSLAANTGNEPLNQREGMLVSLMFGPRSYSGILYYSGFGANPITPGLFNLIHFDPRYKATVADVDSLVKLNKAKYVPGYMNTGYFIQKFAPQLAYQSTGAGKANQNYPQNYIEIRLADTYLMEAEALVLGSGDVTRAATLLNAVRSRVGLSAVPATIDNIYAERRLELATEGHRWYDLVRTGKAATILASKGFVAGKNELLPIPLAELNNTKLVQNPGY